MKSLKEYLVGMDGGTPCTDIHTMVMGDKNDVIHIMFRYNDKTIQQSIKYSDITHEGDDDKWTASFKTKDNIEYTVSADYTHTGHIGYSINNMVVEINNEKIRPDVEVIPYNTFVYGTINHYTI